MITVTHAIVVAGRDDAARVVARVPLVVRTLLTLARAGWTHATIVGAPIPNDVRLHLTLDAAERLVAPDDDTPTLVVGPGTVFDRAALDALRGSVAGTETVEATAGGAWLRLGPGRRVAERGRAVALERGTLVAATAPDVTHRLLCGLENHRDGYLDHLLHRRMSRTVTRALLRTPLTPNTVTVLGVLIGVLGGVLLGIPGLPSAVAAIGCLIVSGVLDCCDGELARIRFSESKIGHLLDVTGDTVVHAVLLAGIARRLVAEGGTPDWPTLGALGVGVVAAFAVISWAEVTEGARTRLDCWENRVIAGILSPLTTRDWHVFPVAFALAGCLGALVPAAAVGAHVFWVVTLVILLRVLRKTGAAARGATRAA